MQKGFTNKKIPTLASSENSDYYFRDMEMFRSDMQDASSNDDTNAYTENDNSINKNIRKTSKK